LKILRRGDQSYIVHRQLRLVSDRWTIINLVAFGPTQNIKSGRNTMKTQHVSASAVINAPAQQIYTILADYHDGHPRILPKPYFSSLEIEQGGVGDGTVIRFEMRAPGMTRTFHADVTEPEPGRVLVESNRSETAPASKSVTTFTVDPIKGEVQSQVTISTALSVSNWLEGLFTTMFLRRVYAQELKQLAHLAEERLAHSSASSLRT
jgi:hypothetical protein